MIQGDHASVCFSTVLGVLSDTHGSRKRMFSMADLLLSGKGAEKLYHLGDNYRDGQELAAAGYPVSFVPGLWCAEYQQPRIAHVITEEIAGLRLAAAHTLEEARKKAPDAGLYLFGHTHCARAEKENGAILINPGHLKGASSKGEAPSAALLEIGRGSLHAVILEMDGSIRFEKNLSLRGLR
jgi:uncharacterized protein